MHCITSASLSVLINGKPSQEILPTRGIRQGDPLSPFLFLLCAEGLSVLIRKEENAGNWRGIQFGSHGPMVSNLLFADDSLIFYEATDSMIPVVQRTLDSFMEMSGQVINFKKSHIYFSSNIEASRRQTLCCSLNMAAGLGAGKYLGLPFMTGRNKKEIFQYVEDRIRKKLTSWKEKLLSPAGKEVLIKSVIQAIPTFVMQCFELPATICHTITSMTRNFWWSTDSQKRPVYWKSWDQLCMSKFQGGMGFRELHTFNLAMLGKQALGIWRKPTSVVTRCLQAKYFADDDFLCARLGNMPSYLWRSILAGRDVLLKGLRYRVGNGESILAFNDKWIPRPYTFKQLSANPFGSCDFLVSDLIDRDLLQWRQDLLIRVFLPMDLEEIMKIPLSHECPNDLLIWHYTKSGEYSVKSANQMLSSQRLGDSSSPSSSNLLQSTKFWKPFWKLKCLPKAKSFAWKVAQNILPTAFNLSKRISTIPSGCPLCGVSEETELHALFECNWVAEIWANSSMASKLGQLKGSCFRDLLQSVLLWPNELDSSWFVHMCWLIWKNRCAMTFASGSSEARALETQAYAFTSALYNPCSLNALPEVTLNGQWMLPQTREVAINSDATFDAYGGACAGFLIRNHLGDILAASTHHLPNGVDVEHGELLMIKHALSLGLSLKYESVVIWSDSLLCINAINDLTIKLQPLRPLLLECRRLARSFKSCIFKFVRLEGNWPAHLLANIGLQNEDSST